MGVPTNAKPGDFFLVSFDGKNPNITDFQHWLEHGGFVRIGQDFAGEGFGEYEHAAVYCGNNVIIQASSNGVGLGLASSYNHDETLWSSGIINPTDAQRVAIVKAAHFYVDQPTPYSWADYAAIAAHRLHIAPSVLKNYVATSKHMICSQLVDQCYQDAGYHLFTDNRWPGYVMPGSLANLLIATAAANHG